VTQSEVQIASFLREYSPGVARQLKDARARLRAFFPHGFELVFNNYNALVFAYAPGPKSSQCLVSLAGYPRWVTLFLAGGASLPDPNGRLEGRGKSIRSLRLASAQALDDADVRALLAAATRQAAGQFAAAPALTTVLKGVSAKRRPRRPPQSSRAR
jgi:hypothetical protein